MAYILFNFWALSLLMLIDQWRLTRTAQFFLLLFALLIIAFLPAFQYNVGSDYFSYVEIFSNHGKLDLYYRKNEFGFYYLVGALKYFGLPPQSLFISSSLIASALILFSFSVLERFGYRYALLFLCFFLVTGMLHNQMNGLRNYLAAYFFVCAILCKFSGRLWLTVFFSIFGAMFHQTFYLMAALLLFPNSFYEFLSKRLSFFFFGLFIFWMSGVPVFFLEYLLGNFLQFYSHYSVFLEESSPVLNVLTKAYYVPLQLWFLFWVRKRFYKFSQFERRMLGFWVLGSSLYLSLLHTGLFFRTYHYLVFFSIMPAYYFLISKQSTPVKAVFILYLMVPYLLKVIVFPVGEYDYQFYLFQHEFE